VLALGRESCRNLVDDSGVPRSTKTRPVTQIYTHAPDKRVRFKEHSVWDQESGVDGARVTDTVGDRDASSAVLIPVPFLDGSDMAAVSTHDVSLPLQRTGENGESVHVRFAVRQQLMQQCFVSGDTRWTRERREQRGVIGRAQHFVDELEGSSLSRRRLGLRSCHHWCYEGELRHTRRVAVTEHGQIGVGDFLGRTCGGHGRRFIGAAVDPRLKVRDLGRSKHSLGRALSVHIGNCHCRGQRRRGLSLASDRDGDTAHTIVVPS
jgi:hypothetical protein